MSSESAKSDVKNAARAGEAFADRHEAAVKRVGRAGVAAEGVVHLLVAWLAAQVALGSSDGSADSSGALGQIREQPGGVLLLGLMAAGFVAMLAWQVIAVVSADKTSHRISAVVKAVASAALAISCVRFLLSGGSSSGSQQQTMTQRLLEAPGGPVLVALAGLVVIGVGIATAVRGIMKKFEDKVEGSLSDGLTALGVAGYVARGVAFAVLGVLVLLSSRGDTAKSRGLDAAFREIADQPYGTVLLLVVALGVAAYGAFQLLTARRRRRA